ncbi:MAG: phage antirepressor [Lachnospiraceae bacterium]|nr:phage antirepressor [Lachnospiraceae bacterium]
MNDIQIFNNETFGEIRTLSINGEPWFVAQDIAGALGYGNSRDAVFKHVDADDKGVAKCDTLGGAQDMTVINESGMYSLILGSKLTNAKKFKHWVTSEVLPSIRKTGGYNLPQTYPEALRALADQAEKAEKLLIQNNELQLANQEMKPKAEFFNAVAGSKKAMSMEEVAKILSYPGIGRNKLFEILRNQNILQSDNIPYQKYIDSGYFRVIEQKYNVGDEVRINIKTLVFQKGVDFIRKTLDKVTAA